MHQTAFSKSQSKDVVELQAKTERLKGLISGERLSKTVGSIGNSWKVDVSQLKAVRQHLADLHHCIDVGWGCQCREHHTVNFKLSSDPYQTELHLLFAPAALEQSEEQHSRSKWKLQRLHTRLNIKIPGSGEHIQSTPNSVTTFEKGSTR